jgi:DNA-binding MarR family transcriptional regulator
MPRLKRPSVPAQPIDALPRGLMTRIGYLLNRPALQIRQMAQAALKPLGLIPPYIAVLSTLLTEGPQTQRALGERLKIDPTTMVWLIDGLEKKRFVRRGVHPKDRRAHLVAAAPSGKIVYERAVRRLDALEDQFLTPLTKNERDILRRLLRKLFEHVPTQGISPKIFEDKNG